MENKSLPKIVLILILPNIYFKLKILQLLALHLYSLNLFSFLFVPVPCDMDIPQKDCISISHLFSISKTTHHDICSLYQERRPE